MRRSFRWFVYLALVCLALCLPPCPADAAQALLVKTLVERRVTSLPTGTLFWRIENFSSLDDAKAASGPWSLLTQSAGKIWLFTLGPPGGISAHATRVADVGPIPRVRAKEYLLRINDASGPPGSVTSVHSHPGSEAFLVLEGEQSVRGVQGTMRVKAGQGEAGHGPDQAMQVSSSGTKDLHALVMFVVDADRPFSSPATLP